MKIIPLKTKMVEVPGIAEPQPLTFADMLLGVMQAPPQQGLSMQEIVERMPVIDALKTAQETKATSLLLEDAQWGTLNRLLASFSHWRLVDSFVVDLGDAVSKAESYTPLAPAPVDEPTAEAAD